jgi:pseudaminic acid cytidylyltransferase
MIAYPIETALASGLFDHIIVSTDNGEIQNVARQYGAIAPFTRPPALANDFIGTTPVVGHAVRWALNQGWTLDAVCCIYPTTPLLRAQDLKDSYTIFTSSTCSFLFSATDYAAPVHRGFLEAPEHGVSMLFPEHFNSRSQDLPKVMHDAGQFYWGTPDAWTDELCMFGPQSRVFRIPRWRVQDIDTPDDWFRAELLWRLIGELDQHAEPDETQR